MKRTGIIAIAGTCALGASALVGGVAYASSLDLAEQVGAPLAIDGVSTAQLVVEDTEDTTDVAAEPTDDATEDATDDSTEAGDDDGTADQGSGDVDEVDPSAPVKLNDDDSKKDDCDGDRGDDDGDHDGDHDGREDGGTDRHHRGGDDRGDDHDGGDDWGGDDRGGDD
ncbi:hypothetical protein [Homoserinibacter sp. GY 40078]|uniref:hypothetical protein n=1 Tax=Homoserinibacter sp. GY 40078 TaxID=2603275 RepID=UPI0011CA5521|nr:hypothetical protein [Homoserinibacter sp. GY 40078]TXK16283.1 hypothetical protein FVQ89_13580 [Homoserinibacter sp. GY 40078]